jgi:hypothetical protein
MDGGNNIGACRPDLMVAAWPGPLQLRHADAHKLLIIVIFLESDMHAIFPPIIH